MGGLEKTEGGSIFVEGQEITKLKASQLTEYRRQSLGFVFQFYNLIGDLSVKENIEVGANISKNPFDIDKLIEDLSLEKHKDKLPGQLSGGQQQRCAIGRALVKNPKTPSAPKPGSEW